MTPASAHWDDTPYGFEEDKGDIVLRLPQLIFACLVETIRRECAAVPLAGAASGANIEAGLVGLGAGGFRRGKKILPLCQQITRTVEDFPKELGAAGLLALVALESQVNST
jgi:hypothetical protein